LAVTPKTATSHRLSVDLPSEAFSHHPWEPERLAAELRQLWLLEQVRQRRLGFSKAAELAGVSQPHFLDRMRELRITPFDFDADELRDELA
jgi:predicted HTH domain antitoxin